MPSQEGFLKQVASSSLSQCAFVNNVSTALGNKSDDLLSITSEIFESQKTDPVTGKATIALCKLTYDIFSKAKQLELKTNDDLSK